MRLSCEQETVWRRGNLDISRLFIFATVLLLGCASPGQPSIEPANSVTRVATTSQHETPVATATATRSASVPTKATPEASPTFPCPVPTQELLWVEAPESPTDLLSQDVLVHIGNGEALTVTTESGTFTTRGESGTPPSHVTIDLLPNTVHHLEIVAQVKRITSADGCTYGGYTMRTTKDRFGSPLVIVQGHPKPLVPRVAIAKANAGLLKRLGSITPHTSLTTDFAFWGDAELVSVGYGDGPTLWNAATTEAVRPIGKERLEGLVVSADPHRINVATGGTAGDPAVRLWNAESGSMVKLGTHPATLTSLAFNPSGTRLASGDSGDTVRIWDINSAKPLATFKGDVPQRLQRFARLLWIDDDQSVAVGSEAIYWWSVGTEKLLRRMAKPPDASFILDAAFGPRADWIVAVAQNEKIYEWDAGAEEWTNWTAKPGVALMHVETSPDGQLVAAGTSSGEIMIWDKTSRELLATYSLLGSAIAAIRFSPDAKYLAAGGWDAPIWLWGIP